MDDRDCDTTRVDPAVFDALTEHMDAPDLAPGLGELASQDRRYVPVDDSGKGQECT